MTDEAGKIITDAARVAEFKARWGEADKKGFAGMRVAYALKPVLDALAAITAERDQARQVLDSAPHGDDCEIDWAGEGEGVHHYPNAGTCTCWKALL